MRAFRLRRNLSWVSFLMAIAIVSTPLTSFAQTKIAYHSNRFKPADDVRLGRQAAAEAEQQFPLLRDAEVTAYVESVGQRLVASIPPEFRHPEFRFYFKVINARDINAFALPGGPMYVNRGMIEAARTEGEMAGVMAHELSHVALRHGTAQATKAQKYAVGAGVAGILGTILGGPAVGQLAQLPIGAYFLKYSRENETQADELGVEYSTAAGYDSREIPSTYAMLKRISEQSGQRLPSFLATHPDPGNREERTRALATRAVAGKTGLVVRQRAYVQSLDGIVFGRDPRHGYFEGTHYYQPQMRFQMTFPEGWQTADSKSAIRLFAISSSS